MMKPKYNNILIDAVMHLGDLIHATWAYYPASNRFSGR